MNRSAKDGMGSSPHYGSEGVTHSPIMREVFADGTIREDSVRDLRRPVGVLVFDPVSDPISGSEMGSAGPTGVGEHGRHLKRETNNSRDRQRQTESGSGKDVREWI